MLLFFLLRGIALLVDPFLVRRLWIEERNREETEDRVGRVSSEYYKIPEFIIHSPFIPQSKGENTRLPWYKEQEVSVMPGPAVVPSKILILLCIGYYLRIIVN